MTTFTNDGVRQYKKRNIDWSKPNASKLYGEIYRSENSRKGLKNKHYLKNKTKILHKNKVKREQNRFTVINYYSTGKLICDCCEESQYMFLTINHDEGRKKWNHSHKFNGHRLYSWLIRNNFPLGFSVKCFNCNIAEGVYGFCIHKKTNGETLLAKKVGETI